MQFEVLKPDHILLPNMGLRNETGDVVFVTVDQDKEWRKRKRPVGTYISRAHVPGNLLAEGMFFVDCSLITLDPNIIQFSEENVIAFNVVDSFEGDSARGDFTKNMPGIVRPLLEWETEFIPG
jgi:lipopolysaccharide transport system ATP-binding protein